MGRFRASVAEVIPYDYTKTFHRLIALGMTSNDAHKLAAKMKAQYRVDVAAKRLAEGKTIKLGLDSSMPDDIGGLVND